MPATAPKSGWKLGEIAFDGRSPYLRSGVYGVTIAVADTALCFKDLTHSAPEASCRCGFYVSYRYEPLILHARFPYSQLFEVEPGGRTIPLRHSLRSETQRVLQVHVNATCYRCFRPASLMCTDPWRESSQASRLSGALVSTCANCATGRTWTTLTLESILRIGIRWTPPQQSTVLTGSSSFH